MIVIEFIKLDMLIFVIDSGSNKLNSANIASDV